MSNNLYYATFSCIFYNLNSIIYLKLAPTYPHSGVVVVINGRKEYLVRSFYPSFHLHVIVLTVPIIAVPVSVVVYTFHYRFYVVSVTLVVYLTPVSDSLY